MVELRDKALDRGQVETIRRVLSDYDLISLCPEGFVRPLVVDGKGVFLKVNPKRSFALSEVRALELVGDHPNIPTLIDYKAENDLHFLFFELVRGVTLRSRKSTELVFQTARKIAEVIEYCHSKGVAHNDVKGENILAGPKPYLLDFDFCVFSWKNKYRRTDYQNLLRAATSERLYDIVSEDSYCKAQRRIHKPSSPDIMSVRSRADLEKALDDLESIFVEFEGAHNLVQLGDYNG